MKKPDVIKKGLECHARPCGCDMGCPYVEECSEDEGCPMSADALAYISQLESQNRCFKEIKESCERRMIDMAQRMPNWISVEEGLPEEGQIVAFIPSCNHGSVYVGVLSNIGKSGGVMFSHREGRYKSNYYAKYWMPLPEPPHEN